MRVGEVAVVDMEAGGHSRVGYDARVGSHGEVDDALERFDGLGEKAMYVGRVLVELRRARGVGV